MLAEVQSMPGKKYTVIIPGGRCPDPHSISLLRKFIKQTCAKVVYCMDPEEDFSTSPLVIHDVLAAIVAIPANYWLNNDDGITCEFMYNDGLPQGDG